MTYLWQKAEWPAFNWSNSALLDALVKLRFEQGRLLSLPSSFVHSYEVSDIKKPLYEDLKTPEMTLERLHGWQASLFPTGYSGVKKIKIAELRNKDLARSSLPLKNLAEELRRYLHWWQEPPVELDPVLRSSVAFLWFMLLSPYEDGNFDLACALTELSLHRAEATTLRTYDISIQLEDNRSEVLEQIEMAARGNGDITSWISYFLEQHLVAIRTAYVIADKNRATESFWKKFSSFDLNQRQRKVLNWLLESAEQARITNRDFVALCKTSRESAKRDLAALVKIGALVVGNKKGRSIDYGLSGQF